MPVRFTCRLLAVRTASGKIKLQYAHLGDDCLRIMVINGPRMFMPPEAEMTDEEFDRWEFETCSGTEFTFSVTASMSIDAPLVEAKRTIEDEIPKGVVTGELGWARNAEGQATLAVRVTSRWDREIPNFSLSTDCYYDAPQPEMVKDIPMQVLSGSESMFMPMDFLVGEDLWPERTAGYALLPQVLPVLRSRSASVSTESHWIAFRTDGYEFDRIPGNVIAAFLDTEEATPLAEADE